MATETDQPSQRAMKAAKIAHELNWWPTCPLRRPSQEDLTVLAVNLDEAFPAYLEIREALERALVTLKGANVAGKSLYAAPVTQQAEAALAKARKD